MSGFVGVSHADERPVDGELIQRMLARIAHRGPDGCRTWIQGSLGFGHALMRTTPASVHETQPSMRHELVIVWDGRLDNREELLQTLREHRIDVGQATDPELVLGAYACFGVHMPDRLLGDFAFVIWDPRQQRLFGARDPVGVKPLYYAWNGRRFACASEIKALFEDSSIPKQMNESMIAEYFLWDFQDATQTFFSGILQLPAGHALCLESGSLHITRYWPTRIPATLPYRANGHYGEQFRELFREAVRCRLSRVGSAGLMLSGGIDSSILASIVNKIEPPQRRGSSLYACTILYDSITTEDQAVTEQLARNFHLTPCRIPSNHHDAAPCWSESPGDAFLAHPDLVAQAKTAGCRVMLTGLGADELMGPSEDGLLQDLLRRGRIPQLIREVRRRPGRGELPHDPVFLDLLRSWLAPDVKRWLKILAGRQVPYWIEPGFAKRVGLQHRRSHTSRMCPTLCQEEGVRTITSPAMTYDLNLCDAATSAYAIEWRHSFLDRRLIEFFWSLPPQVLLEAGPQKQFAKQIFADALPPPVFSDAHTNGSNGPGTITREQEFESWTQTLDAAPASLFQYVDREAFPRLRQDYLNGNGSIKTHLTKMLELQSWMAHYFPELTRRAR